LLVFVAFALAVLNYFFERYHAYYLLPWLDIPMHIVSSVLVVLVVLTVVFHDRLGAKTGSTRYFVFGVSLLSALVVGVLWELFAPLFGHIAPAKGGFAFDTAKDLFNDLLGGALAALLFIGRRYNSHI
jgi:hypothetical protein